MKSETSDSESMSIAPYNLEYFGKLKEYTCNNSKCPKDNPFTTIYYPELVRHLETHEKPTEGPQTPKRMYEKRPTHLNGTP